MTFEADDETVVAAGFCRNNLAGEYSVNALRLACREDESILKPGHLNILLEIFTSFCSINDTMELEGLCLRRDSLPPAAKLQAV